MVPRIYFAQRRVAFGKRESGYRFWGLPKVGLAAGGSAVESLSDMVAPIV